MLAIALGLQSYIWGAIQPLIGLVRGFPESFERPSNTNPMRFGSITIAIPLIGLVLPHVLPTPTHAHERSEIPIQVANQSRNLDTQSVDPWLMPGLYVPSMPSFNSQRLDEQLQNYSAYLAVWGTPDLLIIGSSRSLQGIDPVVLQQTLTAQGYPHLKIYNFSINGATAQVVDLVVRYLLRSNQTPRFMLWADGSRAFNSSRTDVTYLNIRASDGFQQALADEPPIPNWHAAMLQEPMPPICQGSQNHLTGTRSMTRSDGAWRWRSRLFLNEEVLDDSLFCEALSQHPSLDRLDRRVANSVVQSLHHMMGDRPPDAIDINGFLAVETQFDPAAYYQQHPNVPGQYDADYAQFRLDGDQTTAAIALAQLTKTHDRALMFVNLPLSQDYLDPTRRQHEEHFHQHLQMLATQEGFTFQNLNQVELRQNSFFADPSHLNRNGASAVSQYLGRDPVFLRWLEALNH